MSQAAPTDATQGGGSPARNPQTLEREQAPQQPSTSRPLLLLLLQNEDWSAFIGKKRSWQHLAKGVLNRLARDVLQLRDIKWVKEDADLLNNRLQTRRAQGIRTTNDTSAARF